MSEGSYSRRMCFYFGEMVGADKVLLVNADVDDLHQSCCNKPKIWLTNGGKRFDGHRIPMFPFPIRNVAVLSNLHIWQTRKTASAETSVP